MNVAAEFENTQYKEIEPLDNKYVHTTYLMKKEGTGRLYVRKEVDRSVWEASKRRIGLVHPHMVPLDHAYEISGRYYIVEPYISGITLEEYMRERGVLSALEAAEIVDQVLDALEVLHARGIVHRDVTPSNIMVTDDGVVKLLDFGISRMQREDKTQDTTILGTRGFAAPEQFGFRQTDARADLYAVGVLFHLLLTGKYPNECQTGSIKADRIIKKATAMSPEERYAGASDMRSALWPLTGHIAKGASDISETVTLPGFRTGIWWKKTIAVVVYAISAFLFMVVTLDTIISHRGTPVREMLSAVLLCIVTPLLYGNYMYWDSRLPVLSLLPRWGRVAVRIFLATVILVIGMELFAGVPDIPK